MTAQFRPIPTAQTTIFRTKAQRYTSSNQIVIGIAVLYLAAAGAMYMMTERSTLLFPAPLVLFLAWRYGWNSSEEVYFFVQKDNNNSLSFGWMDSDKKHKGDIPIDEFTYWYVEEVSIGKMKNFTLYILLKNNTHDVYLKEEVKSETPPENWPVSTENIENKTGVFKITGLRTLAKDLEAATANQ